MTSALAMAKGALATAKLFQACAQDWPLGSANRAMFTDLVISSAAACSRYADDSIGESARRSDGDDDVPRAPSSGV